MSQYRKNNGGAAAIEFALIVGLLVIPVLNTVDLAVYAWNRMQVDNAAQVAAQAAWETCSTSANLPATPNTYANCPAMPLAVTTAVQSTPLGSGVSITSTVEGYYCINSASALVTVGTFPNTKPANCSSVGSSNDKPGDYVVITASYAYTPVFPAVSIVSSLTSPIVRTAWMRLG